MLSFFRINANYQWISLIVLLGLIRLPLLFFPSQLLIPELQWMLVGEKMGQGFMLYRDIWDSISPFSAVAYWSVDAVFGRSQFMFQVIAAVVAIFQALYFNHLANSRQFYKERTYIPGLIYIVFINLSSDFNTLSPALMATTFLLLAFGTLTKQIQKDGNAESVFEIGFYLSVATLFYLPSAVFLLWLFLCLLIYTGANIRQHILALFGFIFPIALVVMLFFFQNSLQYFNRNLLASVFKVREYRFSDFLSVIITFLIPIAISVIGFFRTVAHGRYLNFQIKCQQIMMIWFITAVFSVVLMSFLLPMQFIIFVPALAFFTVHLFFLFRKVLVAEIVFTGLMAIILLINFKDIPSVLGKKNSIQKAQILPDYIKNQKILVIGENEGEYRNNVLATPYLNWDLAKYDLQNVEDYESVISIYDSFTSDPPTYIIDKVNVMSKIFRHLPELSKKYKPTAQKGIYKRVG